MTLTMITKRILSLLFILMCGISLHYFHNKNISSIPLIGIANYGPHQSLDDTIKGIRAALHEGGYVENENIRYKVSDVNFNIGLISQMINSIMLENPKVIVSISTPVVQESKNIIKNKPLVYACVTDPVESGIHKNMDKGEDNITGATDRQDLEQMMQFAKKILPNLKNIGILYSSGEANDIALYKMMEKAGEKENINVIGLSVDNSRDIAFKVKIFKSKVDAIYVGSSGVIAPALPVISSMAEEMGIATISVDPNDVKNHIALASHGIDHYNVGLNAGRIVVEILDNNIPYSQVSDIAIKHPQSADYSSLISKKRANALNLDLSTLETHKDIIQVE